MPFIRHPEPSLFEGVRISSFKALELRNRGTEKDEILTSSGRRHRTPQNDKVDGRDCHVVQPKNGWSPRNDGFRMGIINQAPTKELKKRRGTMNCAHSLINVATCYGRLNPWYFHCHLVLLSSMRVYSIEKPHL